ncbi:MAG: HAD family phosphatase [Aeriscardovia sp.]|nr:HAD family phosphatase [Aeriscardovia sp.]
MKANDTDKIQNVIFDFGNVLVRWDIYGALISRYTPQLIDRFRLNEVSGFEDANVFCDLGEPLKKAVDLIKREHGEPWGEMMEWYISHFPDSVLGEVPGSRQLVCDLKEAGIGVFGLSNWSSDLFERALPRLPEVIFMMQDRVVSGYIHQRKPDRNIFETAVAKFGVDPAVTAFIDDRPENVQAAAEIGLQSVQFENPVQIREQLIKMGARIPALKGEK